MKVKSELEQWKELAELYQAAFSHLLNRTHEDSASCSGCQKVREAEKALRED